MNVEFWRGSVRYWRTGGDLGMEAREQRIEAGSHRGAHRGGVVGGRARALQDDEVR